MTHDKLSQPEVLCQWWRCSVATLGTGKCFVLISWGPACLRSRALRARHLLPIFPRRSYTKAPVAAPVYNWGGFYLGINAGGGSSHNCWNLTANAAGAVPVAPSEGCSDGTGGLVGGQVGYRWQATNWVFGLEAQGDWANLKGSNTSLTGLFGGFLFQTRPRPTPSAFLLVRSATPGITGSGM